MKIERLGRSSVPMSEIVKSVREVKANATRNILEQVSYQKPAWDKLSESIFAAWPDLGGDLIFNKTKLLPVLASEESEYLFVDLENAKLVDLTGYESKKVKPSVSKLFEFTTYEDSLDANKLRKIYKRVLNKREYWRGRNTFDDLAKWMLIVSAAQYDYQTGQIIHSISHALGNKVYGLSGVSDNNVLGNFWELANSGVLDFDRERHMILGPVFKKSS